MSGGGALTQLVATGAMDTYLVGGGSACGDHHQQQQQMLFYCDTSTKQCKVAQPCDGERAINLYTSREQCELVCNSTSTPSTASSSSSSL